MLRHVLCTQQLPRLRTASSLMRKACQQRLALSTSVDLKKLRNVGIMAHIDAGKTTTTEHMLYLCGVTRSRGEVDSGDTTTDFLPQERERGITIQSAAVGFKWKDHQINLIDTPGHVDFTVEVERSLRVLDGGVLILDAVAGVQAQTHTVWRQAAKYEVPAVAFVNKMDRVGASFKRALESLAAKLQAYPIAIQLPIGSEDSFEGAVDLISMSVLEWANTARRGVAAFKRSELTEDHPLYAEAVTARKEMILRLAEVDDQIMEAYLEDEDADIPTEDILAALKRGTHARKLVPVMCGSSLRGKGVEAVLDAIVSFLPSPADRPPVKLTTTNGKESVAPYNGPSLCALAFKISYDKARGPVTFLRLFSGELTAKTVMHNTTKDIRERPNHVYEIKADELKVIESARSGDVVAVVGLKGTETGDTLVTFKGPLHGQRLAGLSIPPPVFALAIEPETSSEQAAMEEALRIMCIEDPSLQLENDKESGQTLLRGIGELHLEIVLDRLQREHNISVITGKTYVSYRETISEAYEGNFKFDRTLGGKRLFAGMTVTVTPKPEAGLAPPEVMVDKAAAVSVNSEELDAVVSGFKDSMTRGPLAGYPIACLQVTVHAVEKDGDTTVGAIRACANSLVNHVISTSQPTILEPVMAVELSVPDQFMGSILNDVTARGGQIDEIGADSIPSRQLIQARVPLKSLLGYSTSLRSLTQGEGSFTMQYDRHSPVDPQSFQNIVAGNV